jgi:hypothetical protein
MNPHRTNNIDKRIEHIVNREEKLKIIETFPWPETWLEEYHEIRKEYHENLALPQM